MQSQLCVQRADLLAVTERGDSDRAIHVPELRRFQQRQRRNALASSKLKSVRDQRIVLIPADFHFISVALAVVHELRFHAGFSDNRVKMSRSSKSNLIVRDNRVELFLGFAQSGNVVKNDFRLLVLLRTFGDTNLDRVNDRKGGISVINDFHGIVYAGYDNSGHIRAVVAVNGCRAAAPDE